MDHPKDRSLFGLGPLGVDGSEIRRKNQFYDGFYKHPRWLFGISEPSTVAPENGWLED